MNHGSDIFYKPVEHTPVKYEKPEEIMEKVMLLEEDIVKYVKSIKKGL